jgi:hypothetical protein
MADEPQTPAGWYPDPQNPDQPRYWDGVAWDPGASAPPGAAYAVEPQSTNGFAIASLVSGILWIGGLGSLLALVFGRIAKTQIAESNAKEGGGRMASAGVILGWIGIALTIIAFAVIVWATASALNNMD